MKKTLLGSAALCFVATAVWAADAPKSATYIATEDVQKILQDHKSADNNIRVIDMGQGYQMAVAILYRNQNPPKPTPEQLAAQAAAHAKAPCGPETAPAGAKIAPITGIRATESVSDTFIITKGSGTLVTGGTMFAGTHVIGNGAGPACVGQVYGDFHVQNVKVGDIIVIPAGVPRGFSDDSGAVEFLSIRPDPQHVLKTGYVYPGLEK